MKNDTPNGKRLLYYGYGVSALMNQTLPYSATGGTKTSVPFRPTDRRSPRTAREYELLLHQGLDPPCSAA